uniref:Protein FAM162A n=1 Tax=Petromyzon marinus TaxID=7757 RepID=A0AAJ7UKU2_PETMA|nr:protein FAM162A [Petromyzon marinus]
MMMMAMATAGGLLRRGAVRAASARALCAQPPAPAKASPAAPKAQFRVPGYRPTPMDRRLLLWSGRFKKEDDIPETVTVEMIEAARNKLRIRACYVMIGITVVGCLLMVISGKKAAKRNESLSGWNLDKKAQLKDEAQKESAEAMKAA